MTAIIVNAEWAVSLVLSVWLVRMSVREALEARSLKKVDERLEAEIKRMEELERKVQGLVLERLDRR